MCSSSLREESSEPGLILILEDEPVLRASMARGLSKLPGIEAVEAATVREAKKLVRALDPSLLLCDLDLPDGSGIEVAAELDRCGKRVPIVFVSAYVQRFVTALPPDVTVVEKPVPLERLRRIVKEHVATARPMPSPFSAADYIQLASMARRSVVLEMRKDDKVVGNVVLYAGQVWHAEDERGSGLAAFRRLVLAKGLEATCRSLARPPGLRTVDGSCEKVLLEAMQALDEGKLAPDEKGEEVDLGWGDVESSSPPPFEEVFERGIEALLAKDYRSATNAFLEAQKITPGDTRVAANLKRLRELGFGGEG